VEHPHREGADLISGVPLDHETRAMQPSLAACELDGVL
jgi:hypothetical protein